MLGFDPLYIANEGKLIAMVPQAEADVGAARAAVASARRRGAAHRPRGGLHLRDASSCARGSVRGVLDVLAGELLPRIC